MQAQRRGQFLLRPALLSREMGEHSEAVGRDAERGERSREALGALESELGEQEAGARLEGGHTVLVIRDGHPDIVPIRDCTGV